MTRRANKVRVYSKQEESATRLLVKMEASGLSAKELLARGLTTGRQISSLQACESRYAAKNTKSSGEE